MTLTRPKQVGNLLKKIERVPCKHINIDPPDFEEWRTSTLV